MIMLILMLTLTSTRLILAFANDLKQTDGVDFNLCANRDDKVTFNVDVNADLGLNLDDVNDDVNADC